VWFVRGSRKARQCQLKSGLEIYDNISTQIIAKKLHDTGVYDAYVNGKKYSGD
jgi:hypothetical protein